MLRQQLKGRRADRQPVKQAFKRVGVVCELAIHSRKPYRLGLGQSSVALSTPVYYLRTLAPSAQMSGTRRYNARADSSQERDPWMLRYAALPWSVLPWLAPPILGAVIGYVTNRIAIRMLFRPRTAKHILGVRIPFTPGIIPKSRDELARNVGKAVARELLSADAILAQLDSPQLQASLRQWIGRQRQSLMRQSISLADSEQQLLDDLLPVLSESIQRMLRQPALREEMIRVGNDVVQRTVSDQNVIARTAISVSRADRMVVNRMPAVVDTIIAQLESAATPERIRAMASQWLQSGAPKSVNDFVVLSPTTEARIDDYLAERLIAFLGEQIPALSAILDVENLVTQRINTFDVAQVERMILDVTGRHLKWINYFGAGLGAIIGLIQVGIYLIT